jgi:CHAD domain-containing protein
MAAEVAQSEAGTKSVQRIVRKQLAKALESLQGRRLTDTAVHDARKRINKARAALRLLRDVLGKSVYARENIALRDVARPLSQVRDSKVLLDTLAKLDDRFGRTLRSLSLDELRNPLRRERTALRRQVLGTPAPLKSEIDALGQIRTRAGRWRVGKHGWSVVGCGLKRVYGRGRKALSAAETEGTPECFHEWRKQVKYLWHALEFMTPVWPGLVRELADEAHKLADYLGDEHDLTVLRQKAQEHGDAIPYREDLSAFLSLIDRRRLEVRKKAIVLGHRLFEEKPGAFATRFQGYWDNWQASSPNAADGQFNRG